jgi:nucleotide-binding universal stress UspA family protein
LLDLQSSEWLFLVISSQRITPALLSLIAPKETPMTAQHILVPTDFSEYADYALDYAIELAKTLQARLTILYVFHLSSLALGEAPPAVLDDTWQAMETHAQQQTQKALARVLKAGLQGDSVIMEGTPFQTIIDTAKDKGADLIVMGTHGRTGLTHALMGSMAEKVVRLAPCPVLMTRGTTDTSDASSKALCDGRRNGWSEALRLITQVRPLTTVSVRPRLPVAYLLRILGAGQ